MSAPKGRCKPANEPVSLEWFSSAPQAAQDATRARFMSHVVPFEDTNGCRQWTGTKDVKGYPVFWVGGALVAARRMALVLDGREPGEQTMTTCGCRLCVAPDHLRPEDRRPPWAKAPSGDVMPSRRLVQ